MHLKAQWVCVGQRIVQCKSYLLLSTKIPTCLQVHPLSLNCEQHFCDLQDVGQSSLPLVHIMLKGLDEAWSLHCGQLNLVVLKGSEHILCTPVAHIHPQHVFTPIPRQQHVFTEIPRQQQVFTTIPRQQQVFTIIPRQQQAFTTIFTTIPRQQQVFTTIPRQQQVFTIIPRQQQVFTIIPRQQQAFTTIFTTIPRQQHVFTIIPRQQQAFTTIFTTIPRQQQVFKNNNKHTHKSSQQYKHNSKSS